MRVLVTGGCGFIGSHFVKRLVSAGDAVVVLDLLTYAGNPVNLAGVPHDFVHGDVADAETVRAAAEGCDAVVNFAAETHVDRSILGGGEFVHTNVAGTQVLLEWVRRAGVRFVQVSTDEVYGDVPQGASSESDPLRPSSPYAASKASADLLVLAYLRTFGIDASITRGSNAYGPFQYPEKLVPLFITNALEGRPLPVYGDGRQRRTWAYVEDQCAAINLVLRNGRAGEIYNVGGDERENLELSRLILDLTGSSPDLVEHVEDRPGHDRRYRVDSSRIESLGWSPAASLEEGLDRTVDWYRERRDWWAPLKAGEAAA
ncbi:MAG TPA: dTDP-glucose 4,6-dehydratase [Gaiellaceae bacterium]|nr:dTDP-glucose 4,6-dehydratase [Gaiellaceae bacterium]